MSDTVSAHFVTFYSPGTMVAETRMLPIDHWDIAVAMRMADEVTERHGATPYGFEFTTRARGPADLDSKQIARSPFYWLGGVIKTVDQVEQGSILHQNMKCNGWDRIVTNHNSWSWTQRLREGDVVLDYVPPTLRTPNMPEGTKS